MLSLLCCLRRHRQHSQPAESSPAAIECVDSPLPSAAHSTSTLDRQAVDEPVPHPQAGIIAPWTVNETPSLGQPPLVPPGQTIFLLPPVDESPLFEESSQPDLFTAGGTPEPGNSRSSDKGRLRSQTVASPNSPATDHVRAPVEPVASLEPRNSIDSSTVVGAELMKSDMPSIKPCACSSSPPSTPTRDVSMVDASEAPEALPTPISMDSQLSPFQAAVRAPAPVAGDDDAFNALLRSLSFVSTWAGQVELARPLDPRLVARIQSLPKELQNQILEALLATTMPLEDTIINIDDTRSPDKIPVALHINRDLRVQYAEQYYRHGRFGIAEENEWTPTRFASRILRWVAMVSVKHRALISTIRVSVHAVQGAPEFRGVYLSCLMLSVRRHELLKRLDIHERLSIFDGNGETTAADMEQAQYELS